MTAQFGTAAAARPRLLQTTICAATSIGLEATVSALRLSIAQVEFAEALVFSDVVPPGIDGTAIEWRKIARIGSKADYSRFILHELGGHIRTSHALCVQWDGFVLDGGAWDPEFLEYDYIGPVWPHFSDGHNVGNGGFSLRSKRLLLATRDLPFDGKTPEDVLIGRTFRSRLEADGIRFAPEGLARRFAYERTAPSGAEFGFHGAFNLVDLVRKDEAFSILKSLEPQVLNQSEHKELLRWAIRKGYPKLASLLICRILRQRTRRERYRL